MIFISQSECFMCYLTELKFVDGIGPKRFLDSSTIYTRRQYSHIEILSIWRAFLGSCQLAPNETMCGSLDVVELLNPNQSNWRPAVQWYIQHRIQTSLRESDLILQQFKITAFFCSVTAAVKIAIFIVLDVTIEMGKDQLRDFHKPPRCNLGSFLNRMAEQLNHWQYWKWQKLPWEGSLFLPFLK